MSDALSADERARIEQLSADERYDYFIERVTELEQVWTLRSEAGGVLMSADGEECMPVWPDEGFSAAWVADDWADCAPFAISLDAWLKRWLPGMQTDKLNVVVFPGTDSEGLVLRPKTLRAAMMESGQG